MKSIFPAYAQDLKPEKYLIALSHMPFKEPVKINRNVFEMLMKARRGKKKVKGRSKNVR